MGGGEEVEKYLISNDAVEMESEHEKKRGRAVQEGDGDGK